jgi:hypothetical protein
MKDARKIGKNLLPVHRKATHFAIGDIEGLSSARVSAISDLQGVTSKFDRYLNRVVHFQSTRQAYRQPGRRTCHDGPPLRLLYA